MDWLKRTKNLVESDLLVIGRAIISDQGIGEEEKKEGEEVLTVVQASLTQCAILLTGGTSLVTLEVVTLEKLS